MGGGGIGVETFDPATVGSGCLAPWMHWYGCPCNGRIEGASNLLQVLRRLAHGLTTGGDFADLRFLAVPLEEVPDGDKDTAIAGQNYVLSQWPETEQSPTKPFRQAPPTQSYRNPIDIYEEALIQEILEFLEAG